MSVVFYLKNPAAHHGKTAVLVFLSIILHVLSRCLKNDSSPTGIYTWKEIEERKIIDIISSIM